MGPVLDRNLDWPSFLSEMTRPGSSQEMNWPNFFLTGPHKTGSTSLFIHLKRHPQIFIPPAKHVSTFQPERILGDAPSWCRTQYADAKGYAAIGEVNPDYFPDLLVPGRIREICPGARFIIMLRDPVERSYSHYLMARRGFTTPEPATSFAEALRRYEDRQAKEWWRSQRYVEHSFYFAPVRGYIEAFGRDQVLVLLFDELRKNPSELMTRIARHIGVDPRFFAEVDVSEDGNPYHEPRLGAVRWGQRIGLNGLLPHSLKVAMRPIFFNMKKPPLDKESRRRLQDLYGPDIDRLEELLGQKIPELRNSWI